MRIEVVTCDNCGRRIEGRATKVLGQDWCSDCKDGKSDIERQPYRDWPTFVHKAHVRRVMELRDREEASLRASLKDRDRALKEQGRELERLRRRAAEGLAEPDMARALSDVASNARRTA